MLCDESFLDGFDLTILCCDLIFTSGNQTTTQKTTKRRRKGQKESIKGTTEIGERKEKTREKQEEVDTKHDDELWFPFGPNIEINKFFSLFHIISQILLFHI
jgi:hypothetical protein